MRLGQTILEIRKERKMTQEEFAQIFHVTRQTVSNWEKEKNYPDLETLIYMSDEFNISLDAMLKEDKQMAKKINKEIKFSQTFKRNSSIILICILIGIVLGAIGWGIVWSNTKDSLETKFRNGVEMHGFSYDDQSGYYKKVIDQDTYYVLPNQSMPEYFDFSLHFHATSLDYYDVVNGENIQIRWTEYKQGEIEYSIDCLDEHGNLEYTFSEEQERKLCEENTYLTTIVTEGTNIYMDVYE